MKGKEKVIVAQEEVMITIQVDTVNVIEENLNGYLYVFVRIPNFSQWLVK